MAWKKHSRDFRMAQAAAEGQSQAWDSLIERFGGRIFNVARQFATTPAEAEDLTQEIFLKLYRNLHLYRGDVPLVGWTLRLSRNLCIEHYRRLRLERQAHRMPLEEVEGLPSADDPGAVTQRRLQLAAVHRAMAEMEQDLALPVLLRDLQGLSYDEAATALAVPMGTLKSRLVRGRRELAERVARHVAPRAAKLAPDGLQELGSC